MPNSPQLLSPPSLTDFWRVFRSYYSSYRRLPNLLRPRRYSEKMQWRKLFDLNPVYPTILDKIAAREFIASRVGAERLPPLLWVGEDPDSIPFDTLEPPYVLKCNHGCGYNILVSQRSALDVEDARRKLRGFLAETYGQDLREPGYAPIRPGLLAERMMLDASGSRPREYKIFAFDGRARVIVVVAIQPDGRRLKTVYDPDWRWLPWEIIRPAHDEKLDRPARLAEILGIVERLANGFDHLRVDLYDWNGDIRVGELTVYTLGGLLPPRPDEVDGILGDMWPLPHPIRRAFGAWFGGKAMLA